MSVASKAESALRRFERFMSAFPRPAQGQAVRFEALIAALKQLEPLADKVAALPEGTPKSTAQAGMWKAALTGGIEGFALATVAPWALPFWGVKEIASPTAPAPAYSGAGYLTGPAITAADRDCANRIRYELNVRLPSYKIKPEEWPHDAAFLYEQIKVQCVQLLKIATDLDVSEDEMDRAALAFSSIGEALMELPQTIQRVIHQGASTGMEIGQALLWIAGGGLAVIGVGALIARRA